MQFFRNTSAEVTSWALVLSQRKSIVFYFGRRLFRDYFLSDASLEHNRLESIFSELSTAFTRTKSGK